MIQLIYSSIGTVPFTPDDHGDKARSVLVRFKHGAWHRAVNV